MQAFISHWGDVNAETGPFTLAGSLIGESQPVTLAMFSNLYTELVAQRTTVAEALVEESFSRTELAALKAELVQRVGEFRNFVLGNLPESKFARALPELPDTDSAQTTLQEAGARARLVWEKLNGTAGLGITMPVTLQGGYELADLAAAVTGLAPAYQALTERVTQSKLEREERNDMQAKIYPLLKAYRQVLPSVLPPGHALLDAMPDLSPRPGSTPDAVNASGVWAAAESKARLEWQPSDDAALDHYEVRGVPGADYSGDDESVLANIAKGDPLVWMGDDYLTQPGAVASFKVFVVLTTGNEAGSAPVTVVRPG